MNHEQSIPSVGFSRWKQFFRLIPFSKEKFRQHVIQGRAPQPIRFSARCTAYANADLIRFLDDPLNFRSCNDSSSK